jgi:hypothetical protein
MVACGGFTSPHKSSILLLVAMEKLFELLTLNQLTLYVRPDKSNSVHLSVVTRQGHAETKIVHVKKAEETIAILIKKFL